MVVGILSQVAMSRYFATKDRAHVMAATADVDHFRKALAVYEIDYGTFPDNAYNSTAALSGALIDPSGNDYMILPDGANFAVFAYESKMPAKPMKSKSKRSITATRSFLPAPMGR
jgi:hypothetical protein